MAWPTPPPPPRPAGRGLSARPFEQRRGQVQRAEAMRSRVHRIQGFLDLNGLGTGTQEVAFPVWFVERPSYSQGWELADGEVLEANNFPELHSGVLRFVINTPLPHVPYWTGAILFINVTAGKDTQKLVLHWQVEGKALRAPTTDSSGSVDSAL